MACIITFKGEEIPYEDWVQRLENGLLDELINDGSIDISEFKGDIKPTPIDKKEEVKQEELAPQKPKQPTTQAEVKARLIELGLTEEEAETSSRIYDVYVKNKAAKTGRSVEDVYGDIEFKGEGESGGLNQIIGEQGAENLPKVKLNLQVAREMEKAGKTPKEIYLATGWERTKDNNKWKYDLPDGTLLKSKKELENIRETTLGEVLNSNELFVAYPEIKNYKINIINDKKTNWVAAFDPSTKQFNINIANIEQNRNEYQLLPTLLHETQHAIQNVEIFQRGGNTKLSNIVLYGEFQKYIAEKGISNPTEKQFNDFVRKRFGDKVVDSNNFEFELYKSIAGEVEARNVEKRFNMPEAERKAKMLSETEDVEEQYKIYIDQSLGKRAGWQYKEMSLPDGRKVTVKPVDAEVVNGFYSNTENALAQVKQEKMSGNQWATQLLSRGANKEEMTWTGLEAFLKENAAKSISKSDIQQYLKDNRIEVVEVVKVTLSKNEQAQKLYNKLYNELTDIEQMVVDGAVGKSENSDTKFPQYQLEGEKSNYAEKLVILPNKEINIADFVDTNADYIIEAYKKSGKLVVEC